MRMKTKIIDGKKVYICPKCGAIKPAVWYETPVCFKCPEVREGIHRFIKILFEKKRGLE